MRGETDEQFRGRMMAKADQQRYFDGLFVAAGLSGPDTQANAAIKRRAAAQQQAEQTARESQEARERARPSRTKRYERRGRADQCGGTCGRTLRNSVESKAERPDTVVHFAEGKCAACYRRSKGIKVLNRAPRPERCIVCRWKLRSTKEPVSEDTRLHRKGGVCQKCFRAGHRPPGEEAAA